MKQVQSVLKTIVYSSLLLSLGITSCSKDEIQDEGGIFLSREILWQANRIDGGRPKVVGTVTINAIFDDVVVVAGADNSPTSKLIAYDIATGDRKWEWKDLLGSPDTEGVDIYSHAQSRNTLVYTKGSRRYAIDTRDGATIWKERGEFPFASRDLAGDGVFYYGCANPEDDQHQLIYAMFHGKFDDPEVSEIFAAPLVEDSLGNSSATDIASFELLAGPLQGCMAVIYHQMVKGIRFEQEYVSYWGLYDLITGTWKYNNIRLNADSHWDAVAGTPSRVDGNNIYISIRNEIFAYDLLTGSRKWSVELPREVFTSGVTVAEGLCLVNCEDKWLYAFDAVTGERKWGLPSAQLSSPIDGRVLNGVVYWVGGSDKSLFAADIRTGKLIWRLEAERMLKGDVAFNTNLYASPGKDGEKGRLVALVGEKVICIEAHR